MSGYYELTCTLSFIKFMDYDEQDNRSVCKFFKQLCDLVNITVDIDFFYDRYFDNPKRAGEGNVIVFFNKYDYESFISIDTYNDVHEQCDLVDLGVRCKSEHLEMARELVKKLHSKWVICDNFKESELDTLKQFTDKKNYPKKKECTSLVYQKGSERIYNTKTYYQTIEYYVDGKTESVTHSECYTELGEAYTENHAGQKGDRTP